MTENQQTIKNIHANITYYEEYLQKNPNAQHLNEVRKTLKALKTYSYLF